MAEPMAQAPVIAVADRTPVFLHGLMGVLAADQFTVFGVNSASEVRDVLGKAPDLLLLDVRLLKEEPGLCEAAGAEGVPLVLTVSRDFGADQVMAAVGEGIAGLWDRDGEISELRRTLNGILGGSTVVAADVASALLQRIAADNRAARLVGGRLTNRETEILQLMADGAGNRIIAERLFISENTVRNHVRNVLDKLQARSRTEAVVRAIQAGLVRLR